MSPRARRGEGVREPERPLMAAISDALGMPHHDCGKGSNVEGTFLVAIASELGLERNANGTIEQNLDLLVEHLTDERGADYYSEGGTITNDALRVILDGIVLGGHAVVPMDHGAAAVRIELARAAVDDDPDAEEKAIASLELSDERKRSLRNFAVREGQGKFRKALLRAYAGRCAITGVALEQILDAAHIRPYRGPHTNYTSNGLLLRTDLHRLWDVGLLAVHEDDLTVLLAPHIAERDYVDLQGERISIPENPSQHPSREALRQQREWAGF